MHGKSVTGELNVELRILDDLSTGFKFDDFWVMERYALPQGASRFGHTHTRWEIL